MLLVTGRFIQPIRFLFFHQMKMSECEPFSKGSLSIEQVQRKYELFSQLVKIANRWILIPVKIRIFLVINNIFMKIKKWRMLWFIWLW
jgi:hypothetical protein